MPTTLLRVAAGSLLTLPFVVSGCSSPLAESSVEELRRTVLDAAQRELADASTAAEERTMTRQEGASELEIKPEHLDEIERSYNPSRYFLAEESDGATARQRVIDQVRDLLGEDLLGRTPRVLAIGLRSSVDLAVRNNLPLQEARFEPAISETQVVAAEAVFDWAFFNDIAWRDTDIPQPGPGFLGLPAVVSADQTITNVTGLRRNLTTGGTLEVSQELIYADQRATAFGVLGNPNPASQVNYSVEFNQPLLRNFGSDVALADVRLARNAERNSIATLKGTLIDTVTEVEQAYWQLVLAHRRLVIASKLLDRGTVVHEDISARRVFDAVQAQIADAQSTVETRRGDILRAQRDLRRASDRLKSLINDPAVPVGSERLLIPIDAPLDEPITYSLLDSVQTAVQSRPEVDTAILSLDDASIRETVARNGRLPTLDLRASATMRGFGEDFGDGFDTAADGEFLDDFLLGLLFEQPLGNRAGEAAFRRRRLERLQGVVRYQRVVQDVVLDVKNALDDVVTNYKLIAQARTARIAAAEALRTLLVEKELTDAGYSVERLDLEFTQQDALAQAERAEVQALIDYNTSIAELYRAMGTTLERNRINFVVPDANQLAPGESALDYNIGGDDALEDPAP